MYECAMRLSTETFSHAGLKQQVKCYLACLNALRLVNPNYAWIVKPVLRMSDPSSRAGQLGPGASPKHDLEGDILATTNKKPRMDVLEASDIEREFQLVSARLKLANCTNKKKKEGLASITGPGLSANDTLALLISSNLYEEAVKIAKLFKLDSRPILEGLTTRCVRLSKARPTDQDAAWDWLAENNAGLTNATSVEAAWNLLKDLVQRLEDRGQTQMKKSVATRLFSLSAALPSWLVTTYKEINAAELLRLYLVHGYILMAGNFAVEYLEAALGNGKEYFGLANAVHATSAPIWLPHNLFDQLLLELKEHIDEAPYKKLYAQVNQTLDRYLSTVKQVSQDMITVRRRIS
jgi:nuclear pore complex protein Nup160